MATGKKIKVEIYGDILWPYCYIADERFQAAVDRFEQAGGEVSVRCKPYMIDPNLQDFAFQQIR